MIRCLPALAARRLVPAVLYLWFILGAVLRSNPTVGSAK